MEEAYLGYRFLLLVFIVTLNAFFASAEIALVSARQSRLRELAAGGNVGATSALHLLDRPERMLSTVQVGVTLASLGAGWAGEDTVYRALFAWIQPLAVPAAEPYLRAASFVLAFLVLTFVMVVLGEVVPKNLGIKNAERYAVVVAPVLLVFERVSGPFVYVLERSAAAVSRLLGATREGEPGGTHSVEELKMIASSVRQAGRMAPFEETAIHRILELRDIAVREVMVPRNDIVSVSVEASLEHVARTFIENLYTRIPVYDQKPENIIGILHYKDLLGFWYRTRTARKTKAAPPAFRLRALLRRHLVVPESKPLSQMIDEFRHRHAHMATAVDEFGTIVGLITLEDVLEQIFGEIEDEHDIRRPRPRIHAPVLELEGTLNIRDLETQYGIELPTNAGFETLAGFLLFRLGYIPKEGESLVYEGRRYAVLKMEHNRIARVRVERLAEKRVEQVSKD
jgi:CBS domain containing-hemolysin-like protein